MDMCLGLFLPKAGLFRPKAGLPFMWSLNIPLWCLLGMGAGGVPANSPSSEARPPSPLGGPDTEGRVELSNPKYRLKFQ